MHEKERDFSEHYYDNNGQNGDRPALRLFNRLVRRYIPAGNLVDFGCGPGFFLKHLKKGYTASGVEISPWAAQAARDRTGLVIHGSTAEVPTGTLDGIVSLHVVEHIPDVALAELMVEWRRMLKAGGRALVVTPDASGWAAHRKGRAWIAYTDPTHINLKGHQEWERLFESGGFKVHHHFADGLWDFPYLFPWLGKLEVFLLGWPTLLQFILARPLLRRGRGESSILVLERNDHA